MNFDKIKVAAFDMDGTLVDSLMFWNVIWEKLGEKYRNNPAFRPTEESDRAVRTMPLKESMGYIHETYQMGSCGQELLDYINTLIADFYENDLLPKEGVLPFLAKLKERGISLCLASATEPNMAKIALKRCGIDAYIEELFSCSVLGVGKEKPDLYEAILDHYAIEKEELVVFDDSITAIRTVSQMGIPAVGIFDPYSFDQEEMKRLSTAYIAEGETLEKLL